VFTQRRTAVLVAVLGVVALTLVATTLPVGDPPDSTSGGTAADPAEPSVERPTPVGPDGDVPASPIAAVVVFALILVLIANFLRSGAPVAAAALGGVTALAGLAILLLLFSAGGGPGAVEGAAQEGTGGGTTGSSGGGGIPTPLLVLGVFLGGVGLAGAGAVVFLNRADPEEADDEEGPSADPGEIGRVAGRAADRIRSDAPTADNAVYRCWAELTDLADAEAPESYTPSEFASAAAEAGMDPEDVSELRELFEEVRYGDADPDAYEDRALATFERIEATYAEGGDRE
jgi:hypothetical protein